MNSFFYNLGAGTRKAQDAVVSGTGAAGSAVADAAKSYVKGYKAQAGVAIIAQRASNIVAVA